MEAAKTVRAALKVTFLALLLGFGVGAQGAAVLDEHDLIFSSDSGDLTRSFDPALGELRGPVTQGDTVWLGVGPTVYGFGPAGDVVTRLDFSGPISGLDASGGLLNVTAGEPGVQDTYTLSDGQLRERVVLPPLPAVTGWLEQAAQLATSAQVRAAQHSDPTNPFLALRRADLALQEGDQTTAMQEIRRATRLPVPFAAAVRLAALLEGRRQYSAVSVVLEQAERDYAARGYNPALPVSQQALKAYGDPLGEVRQLLAAGQLERAGVWLEYLRRVSPRFEGAEQVYEQYAAQLERQGQTRQAAAQRNYARQLQGGTLYHLGPQVLSIIQDAARLLLCALILAGGAAYALLWVRAWPAQRRDLAGQGAAWRRPLWRLRRSALAYAGLGEKLVLGSFLGALILCLSAWTWAGNTQAALFSPALNMGTYGGAWFYDQLDSLSHTNLDANLLRGLAAQLDGDETQARRYYQAAEDNPSRLGSSATAACIQNNLGVMLQAQGDPAGAREAWRVARSAAPDLLSPIYNLGTPTQRASLSDPRTEFQRRNLTAPMLCYPDQRSTVNALGGNLAGQLRALAQHPLTTLLATPTGFKPWVQWAWIAALLWACAYLLVMLLLPKLEPPRSRTLGGLPRSPLFRTLALLLPGSALLDGIWGGLLLLGWAALLWLYLEALGLLPRPLFGHLLGGVSQAFLAGLLVLSYLINLLCLALSQWWYWRNLRRASTDV